MSETGSLKAVGKWIKVRGKSKLQKGPAQQTRNQRLQRKRFSFATREKDQGNVSQGLKRCPTGEEHTLLITLDSVQKQTCLFWCNYCTVSTFSSPIQFLQRKNVSTSDSNNSNQYVSTRKEPPQIPSCDYIFYSGPRDVPVCLSRKRGGDWQRLETVQLLKPTRIFINSKLQTKLSSRAYLA